MPLRDRCPSHILLIERETHTTLTALKAARELRLQEIADRRKREIEPAGVAGRVRHYVKNSVYFDTCCGAFVIVSAGVLGARVDGVAPSGTGDEPHAFRHSTPSLCRVHSRIVCKGVRIRITVLLEIDVVLALVRHGLGRDPDFRGADADRREHFHPSENIVSRQP